MFDIPEPKKIAPNLTAEQKASMQPLDLMAQYVLPKLLDKINYLEWLVQKQAYDFAELEKKAANISDVNSRLLSMIHDGDLKKKEEKPKRTRSKKSDTATKNTPLGSEPRSICVEAEISRPLQTARIANYNAERDSWEPKLIDGVFVTSSVVNGVMGNKTASYPATVVAFVYDLTDDERRALCDAFPTDEEDDSLLDNSTAVDDVPF